MAIKGINHFDGGFELPTTAKADLFSMLMTEAFLQQVSNQINGHPVEFTELLFQPVPYSPGTPKGMPAEFEPYYISADYVIVNVPPTFMFKAKIAQPSRLCAIYRKVNYDRNME